MPGAVSRETLIAVSRRLWIPEVWTAVKLLWSRTGGRQRPTKTEPL